MLRDIAMEARSGRGSASCRNALISSPARSRPTCATEIPCATDAELWAALEVASGARLRRSACPASSTRPIAQGGTNVSGGQRQRLSIARALLRAPTIYLFDDSFSALDLATEARLRAALRPRDLGERYDDHGRAARGQHRRRRSDPRARRRHDRRPRHALGAPPNEHDVPRNRELPSGVGDGRVSEPKRKTRFSRGKRRRSEDAARSATPSEPPRRRRPRNSVPRRSASSLASRRSVAASSPSSPAPSSASF